MKHNKLPLFGVLILASSIWTPAQAEAEKAALTFNCPANSQWVTNPNPPNEIPKGANAGFCEFYQFSWQWFLQLMSPSTTNNQLRNFEIAQDYPILEVDKEGRSVNSCDDNAPKHLLFTRVRKSKAATTPFVFPKRTGEAGGGDTIYDQNGNVVFFDIRFSRNLCDITTIQSQPNFPTGTTELKTAWRIISNNEKSSYYWIEANIDEVPGKERLGLIGMHVVRSTTLHPEFVWATFEHKKNAPHCTNPQTASGWSFASKQCAIKNPPSYCNFNIATPNVALKSTPTEICRVFPDGTDPSDHKAAENIAVITQLNTELVGKNGYITKLPSTDPMAVFKNYFIVGALWENDITQPSSVITNQRGSMRLTNTVAETTDQDVDLTASFVSNCFGCHNYETTRSNTATGAGLSHIFDDVIAGVCANPKHYSAGPIWSNTDALAKCAKTCSTHGGWNGQWTTTQQGVESVCGCCLSN